MENKKIVIDTNVFISAIIGQYSYPYKIFSDLIATGEYQIYISETLVEEYKGVSQICNYSASGLQPAEAGKNSQLPTAPVLSR